jgi:hypothetical protein
MIEKLGIALQWVLIKIKVLKSDGTRYSSGRYQASGMYKWNPLSWLCLVLLAVPVIIYSVVMSIKDSLVELYFTLIEE